MAGPWEKYGTSEAPSEAAGPWSRYGADKATSPLAGLADKGREVINTAKTETSLLGRARDTFNAATDASASGVFLGFDDEIGAAMLTPVEVAKRLIAGKDADVAGTYRGLQSKLDAAKDKRREDYPVASIAGEIVGGVATGGMAAKSGLTLTGRAVPLLDKMSPGKASVAKAAIEGAGYGAVIGAGEADPGERTGGAIEGAIIGGATGGAMQAGANALANRAANKAAQAAAQSSDELKRAAGDMFDASEASGVVFKSKAVDRLAKRMELAADKINEKLRPKTAGYVDEIRDAFKGNMTLEQFEEFRQILGQELKTASANDRRTLSAMKRVMDNFADNVNSSDLTGNKNGIELLKSAREKWAQAKKTEIVENILDRADVKTGQYTQSGLANTIRSEMSSLYKQIQSGKVKGFTDAEVDLVRKMAKGETSSGVVKLLAKFAPRGVVSFGSGQFIGGLIPIPGASLALPIAGEAASRMTEGAAFNAAQRLRSSVSGAAPITGPATKQLVPGAIPSAVGTTTAIRRELEASPRR